MRNRDTLLLAVISAVLAFGTVFVTGWGLGDTWTIPLVALFVFGVLASAVEYTRARSS